MEIEKDEREKENDVNDLLMTLYFLFPSFVFIDDNEFSFDEEKVPTVKRKTKVLYSYV